MRERDKRIQLTLQVGIVLAFALVLETSSFFILKYGFRIPPRPIPDAYDNVYHPFLGWVQKPNMSVRTTKPCLEKSEIEVDGEGHSITPFRKGKAALHILILGGSSIFGVGAPSNADTVPSQLEAILNQRLGRADAPVEVTNLAIRGQQSFQEMLRLHETLAFSQPVDLVLSVGGYNDAYFARTEPDATAFLNNRVEAKAQILRTLETGKIGLYNFNKPLVRASYTAFLLETALKAVFKPERYLAPDQAWANLDRRVELTLLHEELMETISRRRGAEFIYFLQPTAFTKAKLTPTETKCSSTEVPLFKEFQVSYYDKLRRKLDRRYEVDLSRLMDSHPDESHYVDNIHYNVRGARLLASAIADHLMPRVRALLRHKPRAPGQLAAHG